MSTLSALLFTGSIVGAETWREYDQWQDRPLGVLDLLFGVAHKDLPGMPDWDCDKSNPPRLIDGALKIRTFTIGTVAQPYFESDWERMLSERLGVPVDLEAAGALGSTETARDVALRDRDTVHLAFQEGYFRGPELNEKIEGVACTNLALVNIEAACPEGVAAHEVAHVLGIGHAPEGLMRARAAPCPATLSPEQSAFLLLGSGASAPLVQ